MSEQSPEQAMRRMGRGMMYLSWLIVLALLTWFFKYREDAAWNPNRAPQAMVLQDGTRELVLERNSRNHYVLEGRINGRPVELLLDTGATVVVVPERLAKQLGLERGAPGIAQTANGEVKTYATRIERLEFGNIVLQRVRASISTGAHMDEVLLGMSALGGLELMQSGEQLRIRQVDQRAR